jgi:hypothetical protein
MRSTPKKIRHLATVCALYISAIVALAIGIWFVNSARHGNLARDPGEVSWYKDRKVEQMIGEGFSPEEARRHAFVFRYIYTLADDGEFTKRRFTLAYASLSMAVLCVGAASILSAIKNETEPKPVVTDSAVRCHASKPHV